MEDGWSHVSDLKGRLHEGRAEGRGACMEGQLSHRVSTLIYPRITTVLPSVSFDSLSFNLYHTGRINFATMALSSRLNNLFFELPVDAIAIDQNTKLDLDQENIAVLSFDEIPAAFDLADTDSSLQYPPFVAPYVTPANSPAFLPEFFQFSERS